MRGLAWYFCDVGLFEELYRDMSAAEMKNTMNLIYQRMIFSSFASGIQLARTIIL